MIKKLRKKFISIAMISVIVVLTVIMTAINIANFISIDSNAQKRIEILEENGGKFSDKPFFRDREDDFKENKLSPEMPFETRYFTVTLDSNANVSEINTGRIAAVSSSAAEDYAKKLYEENREKGFIETYKYTRTESDGKIMYIFLDIGRELDTFYSFFTASVIISLAGSLLVFIMVVIFSSIAVRPVAQSYEKQKRFITDASHEIKTPLAIIDANAEVIEMIDGENEWTQSIRKQIKRLTSLTEKLVYLSRMDEDGYEMQMVSFDISQATEEMTELFNTASQARGIKLKTEAEAGLSCYGNEAAIRQLISIMMDNALKYTNENGVIEVKLKSAGRSRIMTFYNTVDEIEKGKLEFLFERFYRLDKSRNSETGGHGIGLSVAKAITEAHGGKISAESTDGKSIIFTITLKNIPNDKKGNKL